MRRVHGAKSCAAWYLHKYAPKDLDWFVLVSSIVTFFGNEAQASYTGANLFQDKLAAYRRDQGLQATTFCLGVIGDHGHANRANLKNFLSHKGLDAMASKDILNSLSIVLPHAPPMCGIAMVNKQVASQFVVKGRHCRSTELFALEKTGSVDSAFMSGSPEERLAGIEEFLETKLTKLLSLEEVNQSWWLQLLI